MGGARSGAGRHKRNCDCEKCQKKYGTRAVDGNLARKIKAKIDAEKKWLRLIELAYVKAETTGNTSDLRHALEYLDDRDLGRCVDTVNHLHDKPIEHNVNLQLSERFRIAMQKGEERVRSLR